MSIVRRVAPLDRLRTICLALPNVVEVEAWRHPTFRVGGKTFVAFEIVTGRPTVACHVGRDEVDILLRDERFFATPYGRGEWISIFVDKRAPWKLVAQLVGSSHERTSG
jgi:predicted DNA-binding protein (MmcQ/YjbR family)